MSAIQPQGYLALPETKSGPGLVVLHAWWGLNQFFMDLCDRLAAEGFVAFAPDLNEGRIAQTVPEAEQIMSELSFERKQAIAAALVDRHFPLIRHVHVNELDGRHCGTGNYDFKPVLEVLRRRGRIPHYPAAHGR